MALYLKERVETNPSQGILCIILELTQTARFKSAEATEETEAQLVLPVSC